MILLNLLAAPMGLIFWTSIAFIIVLVLLRKLAWTPILNTLRERNEFIDQSLKSAEEAKAQMSQLKSDNEKLLAEARVEREKILKEAREMKESIDDQIMAALKSVQESTADGKISRADLERIKASIGA